VKNVFLSLFSLASLLVACFPMQALARDLLQASTSNLLASSKAETELSKEMRGLKSGSGSISNYQLPSLKAFTAQDILKQNRTYERFGSFYKGLVRMEDYLDLNLLKQVEDDQRLAQSVFMYQGGKELAQLALDAPIGEYLKKSLRKLIWIRDLTSLSVTKNNEGKLSLDSRYSSRSGEETLAWFKIHLSPKRGLEPRVRILNKLTLSYDFLESATLIEYEADF